VVVDLLLIGLGITLEPFPLTAFILLLSAEKGIGKGPAFVLGWFVLLATASLLCLELYATFAPAVAGARLQRLRTWLDSHRDQVIILVCLLLGFWLAGKSLYCLA
jgi:hypothetical protein